MQPRFSCNFSAWLPAVALCLSRKRGLRTKEGYLKSLEFEEKYLFNSKLLTRFYFQIEGLKKHG